MPVQGPSRFDAPLSVELIKELKQAQKDGGFWTKHLFHCQTPLEITREGLKCVKCGLFETYTFDPNW